MLRLKWQLGFRLTLRLMDPQSESPNLSPQTQTFPLKAHKSNKSLRVRVVLAFRASVGFEGQGFRVGGELLGRGCLKLDHVWKRKTNPQK